MSDRYQAIIKALDAVKWEPTGDAERMPDDPTHDCVFVDMRPDDFRALLRESAAAIEAARLTAAQPAISGYTCTVPDDCETLHWRGHILSMNELASVAQPAEGEEIMVNTPYDVFILPLQLSGLSSGPRFVVHVPGPEQPAPPSTPVGVPEGWPKASEEDASRGWTLDYGFLDRVTDIAKSRTDYTTSAEASEQVLIAALEVLATTPKPTAGEKAAPSAPVGVEDIIEAFDEIAGLCRHLRQGGPAPEDLHDLSDALDEAVGIAANMLHALAQQPAAVDEAAAIRAFEEHFEASAEDPYFEGELELWLTAWRKALAAQQQGGRADG